MGRERVVRVTVTGRVQGVGFRAWTVGEARRLGLSGWVRNEADGSVAAVFAGMDDVVAEMLRLCHQGPHHAQVSGVRADDSTDPVPEGFDIRR